MLNLNYDIVLKINFKLKIVDICSTSFLMVFCSNLSNQRFVSYKFAKKKCVLYKYSSLFFEISSRIIYLCFLGLNPMTNFRYFHLLYMFYQSQFDHRQIWWSDIHLLLYQPAFTFIFLDKYHFESAFLQKLY
jgi:hypothetical protein